MSSGPLCEKFEVRPWIHINLKILHNPEQVGNFNSECSNVDLKIYIFIITNDFVVALLMLLFLMLLVLGPTGIVVAAILPFSLFGSPSNALLVLLHFAILC
jgi:hypothetical protein